MMYLIYLGTVVIRCIGIFGGHDNLQHVEIEDYQLSCCLRGLSQPVDNIMDCQCFRGQQSQARIV
jgi:hypothetical protein